MLPTGRNIHALDPYRMPGLAALDRGKAAADAILRSHREGAGGAWPETVAVNLWGLDSIKTKGESVAIVLRMVGAAPVKEGTGRIVRFELLPLEGEPFGGGGRGELAGGWGVCSTEGTGSLKRIARVNDSMKDILFLKKNLLVQSLFI